MFLLDSLMISGIQWALKTVVTAAEAEMNDDSALREQLLEAEMRRELGEISDDEFRDIEAALLAEIRAIKEQREGAGPLAFGGAHEPIETSADSRFQIEASVSGDFYDPADAPHTAIVETSPGSGQDVRVLDMEPGDATRPAEPGLPLTRDRGRSGRSTPSERSTTRIAGNTRTSRKSRTVRARRTKRAT